METRAWAVEDRWEDGGLEHRILGDGGLRIGGRIGGWHCIFWNFSVNYWLINTLELLSILFSV